MFATLVIVLPSAHEGGGVQVKHGQDVKIFETATQSIANMSTLTWFTGEYPVEYFTFCEDS